MRKTQQHQARRAATIDRGPPGGGPPLSGTASGPLEVGTIGPNRSLLPDGSLLCRNVAIARTGWLTYAPGEVPLDPPKGPGSAPLIYVHRAPEDVFSEDAMRSFVGVAITDQHPPVPLTPENFAHLGKGFVLNTYRGEGPDSDCLMADLIIKDKWLIERYSLDSSGPVNCEVSCGYEASYLQTGDGQGKQTNIIGNHLALVERGRCGPRCAIGDEDTISTTVKEDSMTTKTPQGPRARIPLAEARARVADAMADLEHAQEDEAQEGVHVHVHLGAGDKGTAPNPDDGGTGTTVPPKAATLDAATEARLGEIEKGQEELKGTLATILAAVQAGSAAAAVQTPPAGSEDLEVVTEATATMDSAALANSYQTFLAQAEVLVPGFKMPTFDAAAKRHATVDRMCTGRRAVLSALRVQAEGPALLSTANGGKEFDVIAAPCPDVAVVFKAAAAAKASSNNRTATGDSGRLPSQDAAAPKRQTLAQVNEANQKFWAAQGPRA